MHFSTVSGSATRQWLRGIPNAIIRPVGRKFREPGVDGCQPVSEGLRLNIRNHQGVLIGRAVQTMFEPLNAASSMSRQAVNIFKIAAAAAGWRGETFAFDGKQLLEVMVTDALDHNVVQWYDPDVCIASRSLKGFLQETDGIKTMTTRSFVEV